MNEFIDRFNAIPLAQKLVGLFVVMVALFIGFLLGVHSPINEEMQRMEADINSLQRERGQLEGIRDNQEQLEARQRDLADQLDAVRDKLPVSAEIPSLLQVIHSRAQTAGLNINRFRRVESIDSPDFIEIPVEMELVGTFEQVAEFFFAVGQMERIVNVRDIVMRRTATGVTSDGELAVTARATTYQWKPR